VKQSHLELLFQEHLKDAGCPPLETQYEFHPKRKWRFDLAHVDTLTAIEIDGGEFARGAHNRGAQMARDYEKRNHAALLGWRVFQLTGQMVNHRGREWAKLITRWIIRW